jgi:dTDP-4-dehydrorhamnose 3,5-epimerase
MIFTPTDLIGAYIIDIEPRSDDRGFFARSYCQHEFAAHGLLQPLAQCNIAHNKRAGTLRGMHWRAEPSPEAKVVRVFRGAILDVIVDLNPSSPSYLQHVAIELTEENRRALYVPPLFGHGFQTLVDNTDVFYQMSEYYDSSFDRGARWNDPVFAIRWPIANPILNDRDRTYEDYVPEVNDHA